MEDTVDMEDMLDMEGMVDTEDMRPIHLLMVNPPLFFHRRREGGIGPDVMVMADSWAISEDVGANKG